MATVKAGYVDGFVLPVPKKNLAAYKKMALLGAKIWREYGAIDYKECVGDDLNIKFGRSFPKLVKTKPSETVVFSWITYKSKAHRDAVNKKVMSDKRMNEWEGKEMPFDMKRMSMGGFKILVDA